MIEQDGFIDKRLPDGFFLRVTSFAQLVYKPIVEISTGEPKDDLVAYRWRGQFGWFIIKWGPENRDIKLEALLRAYGGIIGSASGRDITQALYRAFVRRTA